MKITTLLFLFCLLALPFLIAGQEDEEESSSKIKHPVKNVLERKLVAEKVSTKLLLKEPDFRKRGAVAQYVKEDMEVMTDAELQAFAATYKVSCNRLCALDVPR